MLRQMRLLHCWCDALNSTRLRSSELHLTKKLLTNRDSDFWVTSLSHFSSKDVPETRKESPSEDVLFQQLKSADSTERVLNLASMHHEIMNTNHITRALRTLFMTQKANGNAATQQDVLHNEGFTELCKRLKKHSRTLTLMESVDALKVLSFVGVPSKSVIMQTLLQLVRHQVNDLSLNQIVYLDFLLRKLDACPLVNALRIALPIVFEAHMVIKLDREDVSHLSQMLHFCVKRKVSKDSVEEILSALCHHGSYLGPSTNVVSIMQSLCDLGWTSPNHKIVLASAFEALSRAIHQCSASELEFTLNRIARSVNKTDNCFYNEPFLNAVGRVAVEQNHSLQTLTWLNRQLIKMGYVNIKILDQMAQKVLEEQSVLMPSMFLGVIYGFAYAKYRPANWESILPILLLSVKENLNRSDLPWLRFAVSLAVLGEYPTWLLEKVFDAQFLETFLARDNNILDSLQLLLLYQAVCTLCTNYAGPMPPQEIIRKAASLNGAHTNRTPLLCALEKGLGGQTYVASGLETKLGNFVDHAVVMRKGGYPVAVQPVEGSTSRLLVEDLPTPLDSHRVLILVCHPSSYARNCDLLRGLVSLQVDTLKAQGHIVMPISYRAWSLLPDYEKIPYLMQNIRLLCEEQENEHSVSSHV